MGASKEDALDCSDAGVGLGRPIVQCFICRTSEQAACPFALVISQEHRLYPQAVFALAPGPPYAVVIEGQHDGLSQFEVQNQAVASGPTLTILDHMGNVCTRSHYGVAAPNTLPPTEVPQRVGRLAAGAMAQLPRGEPGQ